MNHAVISRVAAVVLAIGSAGFAQAATVTSNSAGGDAFTNSGGSNTGQALGATGWYYNNVRNNGVVGVDSTFARNGVGSVHMQATQAGNASSKADIEYLSGAVANGNGNYSATTSMGRLADLSEMHYDWYRDSSSTTQQAQHASLRVFVDFDGNLATSADRSYLIFELVYNGGSTAVPVTTNAWVSQSITASTYLWANNPGTDPNGGTAEDATLAIWQGARPEALIMGFSSGVGSGWNGTYNGAVDNIGWTIGGVTTNANFEVPRAGGVPEPASLALVGISLAGLALSRRNRKS